MKINHIVNSTLTVVPTRDATSGPVRATDSSPTTTTASGATHHTGDSPPLPVRQVSRQVGSGDFDAAHVERIHNVAQNDTLKMDAGKVVDAVLSDVQSLLSTHSKKVQRAFPADRPLYFLTSPVHSDRSRRGIVPTDGYPGPQAKGGQHEQHTADPHPYRRAGTATHRHARPGC